jgi:hypothetical protein
MSGVNHSGLNTKNELSEDLYEKMKFFNLLPNQNIVKLSYITRFVTEFSEESGGKYLDFV